MKQKKGYKLMSDDCLKAVHDDDLASLLSSLGFYEKVQSGSCNCHFCGKVISIENLGAIIPYDGRIVFSCGSESCLQKMVMAGGDNDE